MLVCTLGLSILHATRDLAVALVDVTQHVARLSEALATLLVPHELRDHPEARAADAARRQRHVRARRVSAIRATGSRSSRTSTSASSPGQRVGLVGQSGGGKSTLFALLQRFYDVQHGRILIDGQDIARVTQESLREAIARRAAGHLAVPPLGHGEYPLRPAGRDGRRGVGGGDCARAATSSRRCRKAFDTIVGDRGVKLSGGQRQRIAIARAFLKDAPILLLDEATSALDSESEEAIREALGRLMRGRTVIAIAHRLSTLRNFDRIVVLQGRQDDRGWPAGSTDAGAGALSRTCDSGNEAIGQTCGLICLSL